MEVEIRISPQAEKRFSILGATNEPEHYASLCIVLIVAVPLAFLLGGFGDGFALRHDLSSPGQIFWRLLDPPGSTPSRDLSEYWILIPWRLTASAVCFCFPLYPGECTPLSEQYESDWDAQAENIGHSRRSTVAPTGLYFSAYAKIPISSSILTRLLSRTTPRRRECSNASGCESGRQQCEPG